MATVIQKDRVRAGAGEAALMMYCKRVTLTMAAGATTQGTISVPEGSILNSVKAEVATAFTGTPTNINLTVGSAAAGAQVVAATDIKAAGHFTGTIVAAFDAVTGITTYYFQIAAVGGTNPAGTVNAFVHYFAPNP